VIAHDSRTALFTLSCSPHAFITWWSFTETIATLSTPLFLNSLASLIYPGTFEVFVRV